MINLGEKSGIYIHAGQYILVQTYLFTTALCCLQASADSITPEQDRSKIIASVCV